MKKTNLIITFLFLMLQSGIAQSYRTAIGLRLGTGAGPAISVQQKIAKYSTLEGIFQPGFNNKVSSLDLMYQRHHKIGGEVTFKKINVSWDYKPSVNVMGGETHFAHQSAITLRVVVVKQKKKKINWQFWKKKKSKKEIRKEKRAKKKEPQKEKKKINWRFWEK